MRSEETVVFLAEAAWVDGRALRTDVAVVARDGVIRDILPRRAVGEGMRAGARFVEVPLLLPGLINAHCHLEYTHLQGRLPRGQVDFGRWIEAIGAAKRDSTNEDFQEAARDGARRLLAGGCTTVIDTVVCAPVVDALAGSPPRRFVFWETLGLLEEAVERTFGMARDRIQSVCRPTDVTAPGGDPCLIGMGINPHAPYSVGTELRRRLRNYLTEHPDTACSWHLGETAAEVELFEKGSGLLADFLRRNNLPFPCDPVPGCDPVSFLAAEGLLEQCDMVFHLNWFPAREAGRFRLPGAVVHCPSTHAYFEREPFPMKTLLEAGANICLATDSLASADTLNMLEILRVTARAFPMLTAPQLLDMVTRNPARTRVLSVSPIPLGVLAPGAAADFALLAAPHGSALRPLLETLLDDRTRVTSTWIGARPAWTASA